MSPKFIKRLSMVGLGILLFIGAVSIKSIVQTNSSDRYEVKQAAVTGDLSIRTEPGMYGQWFGSIAAYPFVEDYHFSIRDVLFRDGSTADISGTVKYRMPTTFEERIALHREVKSFDTVERELVPKATEGALMQAAKLFGAEEVYSTDSAEFIQIFNGQLVDGIYKTIRAGQINKVALDEEGNPRIAKPSVLTTFGIEVVNIEIGKIDFDEKTDALIQSRKDAEQQETLARAEAERAKQDAITAEERGKATVAKVKYEALAVSEKAVIDAQKQTAIEQEKTLQALEYAKQVEASKKAEAAGNEALVKAGLTPLEEAQLEKETEIGVAQALAGMKWPEVMIFGGEGSPSDPMTALNLRMLQDVMQNVPSKANK